MDRFLENVITVMIALMVGAACVMAYSYVNEKKIAMCDDVEFAKRAENVDYCTKVKADAQKKQAT